MRGFPAGVCRISPTSSASPSSHDSKPGDARRLLSDIASSKRSFAGLERIEVEDADALHGRRLNLPDQRGKIEIFAIGPSARSKCSRQECVSRLLIGSASIAEQSQHGT